MNWSSLPHKCEKWEIANSAIRDCVAWCLLNNLDVPGFVRLDRIRGYGYYDGAHRRIVYSLRNAHAAGQLFSWPGYWVDLTAAGTIAHELGHHWTYRTGKARALRALTRKALCGTDKVTAFKLGPIEVIAEWFRLFLLNPSLLRHGSPGAYGYFIKLGLKPLDKPHWRVILRGSVRHVAAVSRQFLNS